MALKRRYAQTKFGKFSVEVTKDGYSIRGVVNVDYTVPCDSKKVLKRIVESDEDLLKRWLQEEYMNQLQSVFLGAKRKVVGCVA